MTLTNVALWINTIGVGTVDQDLSMPMLLGNCESYDGCHCAVVERLSTRKLPLIYVFHDNKFFTSNLCPTNTLDSKGLFFTIDSMFKYVT